MMANGSGGSDQNNWSLSLAELAVATRGRILSEGQGRSFCGIGTDTRKDLSGQVFVALKGDSFDANSFLDKAVVAKAAAILTHNESGAHELARARSGEVAVVLVDNTLLALQALGSWWRSRMPAKILGVTGTNGKTTVKEFVAAILATKFKTQWSRGSFNNHWGVPISLLSIDPSIEVAMIEMGMNHPGELAELVRIADPDVVGCTMVGRGHLEGMGSIEGVAREKAQIYERARSNAIAIFNADNPFTRRMRDQAFARNPSLRALSFGEPRALAEQVATQVAGVAAVSGLDVCLRLEAATEVSITVVGQIGGEAGRAVVPVFGAHNLTNVMAAACFALAAGMKPAEIWPALPLCKAAWGRNQWVDLKSGARALFDAYNANPESMAAAVHNFARLTDVGRKFAVLGEMREMGEQAAVVHEELGRQVAGSGFEGVAFFAAPGGDAAVGAAFRAGLEAGGYLKTALITNTYEQSLARQLAGVLHPKDIVLFKGSRGVHLEEVLRDFEPLNFAPKG